MSLRLFLLRHAESEKGTVDFERSLTMHGKAQSLWMGHYLQTQEMQPKQIICSPAQRALETAELIAQSLMLPVMTESAVYNADVDTLLTVVHNFDVTQKDILLVGHNPGITMLSYYLTDGTMESFSPCNLGIIEFDVSDWQSVTEKSGRLVSFVLPQAE